MVGDHYVYISTPEATPFQVSITDGAGNPVRTPVTISQGNPAQVFIGNGAGSAMALRIEDVHVVNNNKGLILEGTGDFYVSFRIRTTNHAETLISKGKSAIGTTFRLGSLPQNSDGSLRNFVASFMATEDNTTVNVSDYNSDVEFASGSGNILDNNLTFSLNAGESVVLSGYTNVPANLTGFVGALITSNQPIAVNTGNCLAGMGDATEGQDYNLDQIVPLEQVGSEYILIRGNGSGNTELPLVIATEDNTNVYINGDATPIGTINAGDYLLVPSSFYQGVNNSNMYITSDKPIYMYQIIAGDVSDATSGMNFIPPLSCFFQKKVDLIPDVNRIGNEDYQANIVALTYAGATLSINNVPTTALPEPVLGNTQWVTYKINNVTGNVKIESTGPLAVGAVGVSGVAGFGGYYSGFGSEPRDTEVTICSNGPVNLLDEIEGNPEPGGVWNPPLASGTDIFDPNIDTAGIYNYSYISTCAIVNVDINVTIQQALNAGTSNTITICRDVAPFDLFTLLGTNATTGGTWSPALASGTGLYNPTVDPSGVYTYSIAAINSCPTISATITVTNNPIPQITPITDYSICDDATDGSDTNGSVTFPLSVKTNEILNTQTGISVTYHVDPNDALLGQNAITSINSSNRIIYVRLTNNSTNCFVNTSFNLIVKPLPATNAIVTLKQCDVDNDASTEFNLTEANTIISTNTDYVFTYHTSASGALNNTNQIADVFNYTASNGSTVWARIVNPEGCFRTARVNLVVSTTTIPAGFTFTINECDDYLSTTDPDNDGIDYFNFNNSNPAESAVQTLLGFFSTTQPLVVSFYENESDALAEQNQITNITNYRNIQANSQTIWARIDSELNNECFGVGPYLRLIVDPLPQFDLGVNFTLCLDPVTGIGSQIVDATPFVGGTYSYVWTPANPNGDSPIYDITTPGTYSVVVTNTNTGCVNYDSIIATFSSEPATFEANLITPAFSSGLATIEAVATGGYGIYEYSLDAIDWQSSPIFSNLENGSYTVYVRDIQGCGLLTSEEIQTITYPNYFTPNGDGYNDTWNIRLPIDYNGIISIFDRYGKLLTQISPYGEGWNGLYNGQLVPSTDYWFKVEYIENNLKKEFKSHFSLKR